MRKVWSVGAAVLLAGALAAVSPVKHLWKNVGFPPDQELHQWSVAHCGAWVEMYTARPGEPWYHRGSSYTNPATFNEDVLQWPGGLVLVVFVACNQAGCSPTQHGSYPGEGYFPSEGCP